MLLQEVLYFVPLKCPLIPFQQAHRCRFPDTYQVSRVKVFYANKETY